MTAVDESPSPSPTPPPRRPLFGFGEPKSPPPTPDGPLSSQPPSPMGPLAGTPHLVGTEEDLAALEQDSLDEWDDDSDLSESPGPTSSQGSTRVANPVGSEGLRDMARAGVLIAGDQAHNMLARTPGQQAVGLYRTDTEDAEAIGDPLARIAGRHQGIGEVSPDTADLLASMMGLARYATKQITKSQQAKDYDHQAPPVAEGRGAVDL